MKDKVKIIDLKAVARVAGFLGLLCVGLVIQHPDSVFAATYSVGLTTSGTINIDVSTSGIGAAVATDNLVATSTCPLGYTITIQGPSDTNLYKDGSSSNNDTNTKITPSAGTIASPLPIAGDNGSGGTYNGTWGYSLTSSTSTGTFIGLSNTSAILTSKNTGSGDGTSTTDTIPVYYGVSTLPTQEPGIYSLANSGKINYFITTPLSCTSNAVTLSLTDASAIVIDDTPYTASDSPVSLSYGTHTISGTFSQGYEFDSWSTTGDITITDASANATTINVTGAGTLTLAGKSSKVYMQDLTLTQCQVNVGSNGNDPDIGDSIIVYDRRDEKDYTVRYIYGACWMTQNLRFTGTSVPAATSNVTADKTLTYYSLNSSDNGGFGAYSGYCNSTNGYNYACIYNSGSTTTGVWYNYYAATAGTIAGSSNNTLATEDICPAGWHLPSYDEAKPAGSINSLLDLPITSYFSPVTGGYYYGGRIRNTDRGYWWSSVALGTANRYVLVNGSSLNTGSVDRGDGYYIRCVRE